MADLREVQVLGVYEDDEIASVSFEPGHKIGVNLWEVEGYSRRWDGLTNWKYRQACMSLETSDE